MTDPGASPDWVARRSNQLIAGGDALYTVNPDGTNRTPLERSAVVTVGTPDANGAPASMVGSVRYAVQTGDVSTPADEADVAIHISVTDVRGAATNVACPGGALSDYTGKLLALTVSTRITIFRTPPGPNGVPGTGFEGPACPPDCGDGDETLFLNQGVFIP